MDIVMDSPHVRCGADQDAVARDRAPIGRRGSIGLHDSTFCDREGVTEDRS
jgi:hypothetical protein